MNYGVEWMPIVATLGLLTLLFVPILGMLIGMAIVAAAAMALVALIGAVISSPYLIVRAIRGRRQARPATREPSRPVPGRAVGRMKQLDRDLAEQTSPTV